MAKTTGLSGQACICMAPTHWDLLLGLQASLQRYGVLQLRALLDFCFSSARSWSHPPDLWIILISVMVMGKLRQGGVVTYPMYTRTRRAESTLCLPFLPRSWLSGVSHQEAPQVFGVKSCIHHEKRFLLLKGRDYLVNICVDNS